MRVSFKNFLSAEAFLKQIVRLFSNTLNFDIEIYIELLLVTIFELTLAKFSFAYFFRGIFAFRKLDTTVL